MPLIFSNFYSFNQLARLNLGGGLSPTWDGTYVSTANGMVPNPGSGLISGGVPMLAVNALPPPIQALLQGTGVIYIFVSVKYRLLYVGISGGNLQTGVFGQGRISHHARKLLAACGGGTNHTSGWTAHAFERYQDVVNSYSHNGATLAQISSYICSDWHFAFALCDAPRQHEGFVKNELAPLLREHWGSVTILNNATMNDVPIDLQLPPNLANVIGQTADQRANNTVETRVELPGIEQQVDPVAEEVQQGSLGNEQKVDLGAEAIKFARAMDPLGGEEHVDEIDPVEGLEDPDQWDEELDGAVRRGKFPSNRGRNWTVLPSSTAGCSEKLLVDIRNSSEISPLLDKTVAHLGGCTVVKLVVFHVGGDIGYMKWMRALLVNLPVMQSLSPGARFVTRVARSWMPRACQRSCWMGAMGNGMPEIGRNYQVPLGSRAVFKHRIWLLEELGLLDHDFGFIANHTDQPTQPPAGSNLSFGTFRTAYIENWKARLYFGDSVGKLPLGFGEDLLRGDTPRVNAINGAWIATDRSAFYMNPYAWINRKSLDQCRLGV